MVFEDYQDGDKFKITLPSILEGNRLNVFRLTIQKPGGELKESRMSPKAYLQLVAATNFKQRVRKMMEYYHADRLSFAVAGTPNRLEYDQGFFVKNGDGSADLKPIAHLYKSQVYQLAAHLGVPDEICKRPPTTDTYSMPQTQEEFYFALPYDKNGSLPVCTLRITRCPAEQGRPLSSTMTHGAGGDRVFKDIESQAPNHSLPASVASPLHRDGFRSI